MSNGYVVSERAGEVGFNVHNGIFLYVSVFANGNHFAIASDGHTGKDGRFCSYNHAANKGAVRGDVAVGIKMDIVEFHRLSPRLIFGSIFMLWATQFSF